jgi:hypothetical protein
MCTDSISIEDTPVSAHSISSLKLSVDDSQTVGETLPPLLPRSAWNSQVEFLKALFRAKKSLDRIEKEAGVLRS